jgi:hypothetical protein
MSQRPGGGADYEGEIPDLTSPRRGGIWFVRYWVTIWLLALVGIQILVCLGFVFWHWATKDDMTDRLNALKDLLTITFGPSIALLSSAIGFYFGRQ